MRLHWSWVPALGVLAWTLAVDHFPANGVDGAQATATAVVVALFALGSVFARELARRFAASTGGFDVSRAALWPAGSPWVMTAPPSLRANVRMLGSGFLASFILAGVFAAVAETGPTPVAEGAEVLARFNAAYGIFGLIPALPLDGGAFLCSGLMSRGVAPERARRRFATAGICFGFVLVAVGGLRVAAGDASGGIGLAVAGLTLGAAARVPLPGRSVAGDRRLSARGVLSGAALGAAMIFPAATLYHLPLFVISPGAALDVLDGIRIRGLPVTGVRGRYVAASVEVQHPTALHGFTALFRSRARFVRRSQLPPLLEDPFGERGFGATYEGSRLFAAAAASRSVGLDVVVRGTGARVLSAGLDARAAGVEPGDVIVAVDGSPVRTLIDLRSAVTARPSGTAFDLVVDRHGRRVEARIRSRTDERSGGLPGLDVGLETRDLRVDLPYEVSFPSSDVGGPSAGLAFALALADLLDPRDIAAGRTVAATGVIHLTGRVDPIVGVTAKRGSATDAGADVFVVSSADAGLIPDRPLRVFGVRSLDEAIALLIRP